MSGMQQGEYGTGIKGGGTASRLAGARLWNSRFLSEEERRALDDIVGPARTAEPNVVLLDESGGTDCLFIVTEGWACRVTTTRDGLRQFPALLVPGDVANLDSLMFDRLDYAVQTLSRATILPLPLDRVRRLAAQHPGIAQTFAWLAMLENATLGEWAASLGQRSASERLAHLLCELSVRLGLEDGREPAFAFPLTHTQLGDALGLTSVHVNRTMHRLSADGLVTVSDRTITLPDFSRLREIAGFDPHYLHIDPRSEARPASAKQ